MWLAWLATAVWLGLQLWTWWPPYLFGASDRWSQVYARAFAESTPILPRWGNHLPPDAAYFLTADIVGRNRRDRGTGTPEAATPGGVRVRRSGCVTLDFS